MNIEKRIENLGLMLPNASPAAALYVPVKQVGNIVFLAGHIPVQSGKLAYTGKVGKELTLTDAQDAARLCVINLIASLKAYLGDLDKVKSVIKVQAFVASETGFMEQHLVADAASKVLIDVFGDVGKHARTAIGTNQLPLDAPVEVEAIVELY